MKSKRTAVFWVVAMLFVAFLLYSTLGSQRAECTVCIEFKGGSKCAKASGADRAAAQQAAQTTACGPLASGMDDTIACGRLVPASVTCTGE